MVKRSPQRLQRTRRSFMGWSPFVLPQLSRRTSQYLNNVIEQDHRPIKQRYYPMRGFGSFASAARFCTAHEVLRAYLRLRSRCNEVVSLADQRRHFERRWTEVCLLLAAG
jgi:transposase-like protein